MNTITTETENPAALQLKIQHYVDMSLNVLEGIFPNIPEGFSVVTTSEGVYARYIKDIDADGQEIHEEKEYIVDPATVVNVHVFLWNCVEEARVFDRMIQERINTFSIELNPPALAGGAFSER